jgi:hypothetical protein
VCNQPVKKSAVFCTECSLIAHSKCAADAPQTCDLRAQVIRLSQDVPWEGARQQSPSPLSSSPLRQAESPISSSPPDRFRIFGRKKSKVSGLAGDATESSKPVAESSKPVAESSKSVAETSKPTPPVAFRYDDAHPTKRTVLSRPRKDDDHSRSRASVTSSQQSSSMRSAATAAGSLSSDVAEGGDRVRRVSVADSENRASRITDNSLLGDVLMTTDAGEEAYLKRKGSRRDKKESDSSRSGCVVQ